jgi:site-specific DNA recombinase
LRGFVVCDDCDGPLTACWSISGSAQKKRHPYYQCPKKGCACYGKTIRRDLIKGEFEAMLRTTRPQPQLFAVATAMFNELWTRKQTNAAGERKALKASLAKIKAQIDQAVERVIETSVPAVSRALEQKVQKLTSEKLLIAEKIESGGVSQGDFERRVGTGLAFLANPCNLWVQGETKIAARCSN